MRRVGPAALLLAATVSLAACSSSDTIDGVAGGAGDGGGGTTPTLGAEVLVAPVATVVVTGDGGGSAATTPTTVATTATTADPVAAQIAALAAAPLPASPDTLAAELSEAEAAVGDATLPPDLTAAWGRRQQLLYRVISAHPDWAEPAIAAVDPAVRDVVALNWEARSNLSALVHSEDIASTLPAWEVQAPRPAEELLGYYREAAEATGVPWEVLAAINLVETRMGRISGLSTAGAVGPMQFLPSTWAGCCTGDPTDPHDAILGAATYLVDRGAPGNMDRAIFGYNNSDRYVRAVQAYAQVLSINPQRYHGYHAWEVVFLTTEGLVQLPVGYRQPEPVDAATWLATNPGALVTGAA